MKGEKCLAENLHQLETLKTSNPKQMVHHVFQMGGKWDVTFLSPRALFVHVLFFPTLPETNLAHEHPIFLGKYHQNGGFSMAMLVYRRVVKS